MAKLFQYTNYIDYDELVDKPLINKVVVEGDKSLDDYGIQPAGNYAHLNENGKVPLEELDDSILGNLQFQSTWNASTNSPQLPLVPQQKGQYWIISVAGERFGLSFEVGDWLVAGDGVWQKVDNSDAVFSVNNKIGNVVLTSKDIDHDDTTVAEAIDSKQNTLTAGKNIIIENDVISAEFNTAIIDYNLTYNKPAINNVELIGNKTLEDFDVQRTIKAGQNVYLTQSEANKMLDTVNVYDATESRKGVSEIATQAEVNTGTDDFRYVTPKKLKSVTNEINNAIEAETNRATQAEQTLTTNLNTEIGRAKAEEQKLSLAIDMEKSRAEGVEQTLTNDLKAHKEDTSNPHSVTKAQVGLGNVDNTSDLNKPISTATQNALDLKADANALATVASSGSYNDLSNTPTQVSVFNNDALYVNETQMNNALSTKAETTDIPTKTSQLENDSGFLTNANYVTPEQLELDLETKQDVLTFDTVPTTNSSNPVTSGGVKTAIDAKQDIITGGIGEVLYHNGTSVFSQTILNEGMICTNTTDLNTCKNNAPSFQEVFNTWTKFSHLNGVDDAVANDLTAWSYDEENDTIKQPNNSTSYCGFVSPKTYSSYDVTVRLYSTGSDDDQMSLVAAFATDSNGKQHTLSFIRSPWNNTGTYKWICKVDHCVYDMGSTTYDQIILVDKTSSTPQPTQSYYWNTTYIGVGTVINMKRDGNIITAVCSQFNSTTLDENTRITIDLDALSDTYPVLNNFKGSASWGYGSFSQPSSMYENISVTDPDGYIFDTVNNQVLQYNSSSSSWEAIPNVTPASSIGAGRLSYNKITGKLYYCTGNDIIQIATNADI